MRSACWIVLACVSLLFSCGEQVRFEQPQPKGIPDLERVPARYHGSFYSADDSSNLEVTAGSVVAYRMIQLRVARNTADESVRISGDTIIDDASGHRVLARPVGDSLEFTWPLWTDTLLAPGPGFHLRRYRGHFFLNALAPDGTWSVRVIEPRSTRELAIEELQAPEDIDMLRDITPVREVRKDSLADPEYLVDPARKELRTLMQRGFTTRAVYRRIRR